MNQAPEGVGPDWRTQTLITQARRWSCAAGKPPSLEHIFVDDPLSHAVSARRQRASARNAIRGLAVARSHALLTATRSGRARYSGHHDLERVTILDCRSDV